MPALAEGGEEEGEMPPLVHLRACLGARASTPPPQRQVHGGENALCALFCLLSPPPMGQQPSLCLPSLRPPWRPLQSRPFSHSPRAAQACAILHAAQRAVELFSPACDAEGREGGEPEASATCTSLHPQALTQALAPLAVQGGLLQATAQALPLALRELALAGKGKAAPHFEHGSWDGASRAPWEYPLEAVEEALLPILAHAGLTEEVCEVAGACGSAREVLGLRPLFSASEPQAFVWDEVYEEVEGGLEDWLQDWFLQARSQRERRAKLRGLRGVPRLVWHALRSLPPYSQGSSSPAAAPDAAGHALRALSRAHLLRGLMLPTSTALEPQASIQAGEKERREPSWLPPVLWAVAEGRPEAVLALVRDLGFAGDEAGALTRPSRGGLEDMGRRRASDSASGGGCQAASPASSPGAELTTPQALAQRLGRIECLQALAEASSSPAPLPPLPSARNTQDAAALVRALKMLSMEFER